MAFETSIVRLWRSLGRPDRDDAARAFWAHPPEQAAPLAAQEIVKLLRVRPQAFSKIPLAQRVHALAGLAHPAESVAEALLVALHLEQRRSLLVDFLDALGIPHEEGLLAEDVEIPAPDVTTVRAVAEQLRETHGASAIRVYWNALWLQDPERWGALETVADELFPAAG